MIAIDEKNCIQCGLCAADCPFGVLIMKDGHPHFLKEACMDCGHCLAVCPKKAISMPDYDMSEVQEYEDASFAISPERLLNFIKFRRTVRQFQPKEVSTETIQTLLEAGRFTPTGSNAQNVRYIAVRKERFAVKELILKALNEKGNYIASHKDAFSPVLVRYGLMWQKMYRDLTRGCEKKDLLLFDAPLMLLVVSEAPLNAGLAAESIELMAAAMGLGSVFSGFSQRGLYENPEAKAFLGLAENEEVRAVMMIGYPKVKFYRTVPRKKTDVTYL